MRKRRQASPGIDDRVWVGCAHTTHECLGGDPVEDEAVLVQFGEQVGRPV